MKSPAWPANRGSDAGGAPPAKSLRTSASSIMEQDRRHRLQVGEEVEAEMGAVDRVVLEAKLVQRGGRRRRGQREIRIDGVAELDDQIEIGRDGVLDRGEGSQLAALIGDDG